MNNKFLEMNIKERLTAAFKIVIIILCSAAVLGVIVFSIMINRYGFTLKNYAFPQGTIGKAMTVFADIRSATRAVIGYEQMEDITSALAVHDSKKEALSNYVDDIEKTIVTKEGEKSFLEIKSTISEYYEIEKRVLEIGATEDTEQCTIAQKLASSELDPAYDAAYSALAGLMDVNVDKGNNMQKILGIVEICVVIVIAAIIIAGVAISIKVAVFISGSIVKPVAAMEKRLKAFSEGDLSSYFPVVNSKDEIASTVDAAQNMSDNLNLIISDCSKIFREMANGNFAVTTDIEEKYVGDFKELLEATKNMNRSINDALKQVDEASKQVSAGANNMAEAAQALAEGATDQAASVQQMQATITNITDGIRETATAVQDSYDMAQKYASIAESSRLEMEDMIKAMDRINETSKKIENIISELEDIASQTNLLSLNASIEAARAGDAGRGFAVVADQIRTLAEQSSKSAVDTRHLIEGSLQEVSDGNSAAQLAANSIKEVVSGVKMIAETAKELNRVSAEQAAAMEQADIGISRISEVVQSNAATAQETSASSQELSAESITMKEMIDRFVLRA